MRHGKDGVALVSGTVFVSITGFSYSETQELADGSVCGDDFKRHVPGQKDGGGSVSWKFEPENADQLAVFSSPATVTGLKLLFGKDEPGTTFLEGTPAISDWNVDLTKDDVISGSFNYKGGMTFAKVPGA